jgi:hypothetical protein
MDLSRVIPETIESQMLVPQGAVHPLLDRDLLIVKAGRRP